MKREQRFVIALVVLGAVIALAYVIWRPEVLNQVLGSQESDQDRRTREITGNLETVVAQTPGALPELSIKSKPLLTVFKGCPPEGDGGDAELNRLKNREDEGVYSPVQFDAVMHLTWPDAVERRDRDRWSAEDRAQIERYEGLPIAIEGYLAGAKESGPESTNCHGADKEFRDYHLWLTQNSEEDRSLSIVVEPTPRLLAKHPGWRLSAFRKLVSEKTRVRLSGWLMFDPEHPDQVGKTRGTIWEVHPMMQAEVWHQERWVTLDEWVTLVPIKELSENMRKAIRLRTILWVEGEDEPAHDFARSTMRAVRKIIETGSVAYPELQVRIKRIVEESDLDDEENDV